MKIKSLKALTITFLFLIILIFQVGCTKFTAIIDPAEKIPVLMYHGLLTEEENQDFQNNTAIISVEDFEEQMKYLAEHKYHTVTAEELDGFVAGMKRLPRKSVMIQFDDGMRDMHRYALPIMEKYKLHGIANIITGRQDINYGSTWDPNKHQYMDVEMLGEITSVFSLHSHTDSLHTLNNNISGLMVATDVEATIDLQLSKDKLSQFNHVEILAYPFGQYNPKLIELVKETGFSMAFTIEKGYVKPDDHQYKLNRIGITPQMSLEDFEVIVTGKWEKDF